MGKVEIDKNMSESTTKVKLRLYKYVINGFSKFFSNIGNKFQNEISRRNEKVFFFKNEIHTYGIYTDISFVVRLQHDNKSNGSLF